LLAVTNEKKNRTTQPYGRKKSGPTLSARHGLSGSNYQAAFDNQYYRLSSLDYVDGYLVGSSVKYAAIWHSKGLWSKADLDHIDTTVKSNMTKWQIDGASLAITKKGKLVFAQGYGKADVENNLDASPKNLWRIASISKPITAVAIMRLQEEGKLTLDDKVFGLGSILGCAYVYSFLCLGPLGYDDRELKITVRHLLEHTAGGITWNNNGTDGSSDPMFLDNILTHEELIKKIIKERQPSSEPGTLFSYSNFGYCLLGRIIEID